MYVCICHGVTDKDIQQAAQQGVSSMEKLSESMQVGSQCGCCKECANQVLEEALNKDDFMYRKCA
jgi:bacterioferritin-associated ferredoxin